MNRKKFKNIGIKEFKHLESSFYSELFEEKKELTMDGHTIGYMSKKLNKTFIENLETNPNFQKGSVEKIKREIQRKTFIPVYSSKYWVMDIMDTFMHTFFRSSGYVLGFYDGKKIVTMITNLRELNGTIPQEELYEIITHEYQHKFANDENTYSKHPKVKKVLHDWYTFFIDEYFGGDLSTNGKKILLKFWTDISFESNKKSSAKIANRYEALHEIYSSLRKTESSLGIGKLAYLLGYLIDKYNMENDYRYNPSMSPVFKAGRLAYKSLGVDSRTLVYQEFLVPSEVTAVTFSMNKSLGNQALMKWLK